MPRMLAGGRTMARFPLLAALAALPSREARFAVGVDYPAGNYPCSVAIGLLDGDGAPDLAVVSYGSNSVSVLLGNGDGTFRGPRQFPTAFLPYMVTIPDRNLDGR